ncbi:MAG: MarR family winged helix-turn-helix transcriptional regulator [Sulfitobacter sp.]
MTTNDTFDLRDFIPYLLNQAADATSLEFNVYYKERYGMLRTEWRILFHLGRYGAMPAKEVCSRARIHKTKVSRAVAALEKKRFLARASMPNDRRHELLSLTTQGTAAFADLCAAAQQFDADLASQLSPQEAAVLRRCLKKIAAL